jgi:hypothetical protein
MSRTAYEQRVGKYTRAVRTFVFAWIPLLVASPFLLVKIFAFVERLLGSAFGLAVSLGLFIVLGTGPIVLLIHLQRRFELVCPYCRPIQFSIFSHVLRTGKCPQCKREIFGTDK